MILSWIPNSTLKHNPRSIENSPARISPRRSPKQEFACTPTTPLEDINNPMLTGTCTTKATPTSQQTSYSRSCSNTSGQSAVVGSITSTSSGYVSETPSLKNTQKHSVPRGAVVPNNTPVKAKSKTFKSEETKFDSVTSPSTDSSESPDGTPEKKLFMQLQNKNRLRGSVERMRERNSSSRSITSIEMEGDSLVVVTEELNVHEQPENLNGEKMDEEDDIFNCEQNIDDCISCTNSCNTRAQASSSNREHNVIDSESEDTEPQPNNASSDVDKLKSSLDLKLTLTSSAAPHDVSNQCNASRDTADQSTDASISDPVASSTSDSAISPGAESSDADVQDGYSTSSGSTSGPDSRPSTPLTPVMTSPVRFSTPITTSQSDAGISPVVAPGVTFGGFARSPTVVVDSSATMVHDLRFPQNSVTRLVIMLAHAI